ncbi:MAG: 16S rRNA (guanine(966)-N(2))-methyltransferase RsmD [Spirochaetes bacterium]|nr:16S rRNA (guanine(966)-N(2))-methyltransferase RsmD [Spirochaetota bacterium]
MASQHTMRVIGGSFKGRIIPFEKKLKGAEATSQRLKKAVFSILGEDLTGKKFLDLFSGTGQMGIEALSRGSHLVVFNDSDRTRYQFVKEIIQRWELSGRSLHYNSDAARCIKMCSERGVVFDVVYCDPPFEKIVDIPEVYKAILKAISESTIVHEDSVVLVQHYHTNIMPQNIGRLIKKDTRKYGTNSLSIYKVSVT